MDITITASAVAWYAAVVSTCSMAVSVFVALRDRARLKVEARTGYTVMDSVAGYQKDKLYIMVTVANAGRRPVTLGNVALLRKRRFKGGHHLLTDSFLRGPTELPEGKSATFLVEQAQINLTEIRCAIAYDQAGRQWRGRLVDECSKT